MSQAAAAAAVVLCQGNSIDCPAAEQLKQRGNECFRHQQWSAAQDFYTRALALAPTSAVLYTNRAICHIKQNRPQLAECDARQALQIDPVFPRAHIRLGEALYQQGKLQAAYEEYDQATKAVGFLKAASQCTVLQTRAELATLETTATQRCLAIRGELTRTGRDPVAAVTPNLNLSHAERHSRLAQLVVDFLMQSIRGCERAQFRTQELFREQMRRQGLPESGSSFQAMWTSFSFSSFITYLNTVYKNLILEDDAFITRTFRDMSLCTDHSRVCLLQLMAVIGKEVIPLLPPIDKRNMSDLNAFTSDVDAGLKTALHPIGTWLSKHMNHVCKGIDIKTCDPNKPLFHSDVSE